MSFTSQSVLVLMSPAVLGAGPVVRIVLGAFRAVIPNPACKRTQNRQILGRSPNFLNLNLTRNLCVFSKFCPRFETIALGKVLSSVDDC